MFSQFQFQFLVYIAAFRMFILALTINCFPSMVVVHNDTCGFLCIQNAPILPLVLSIKIIHFVPIVLLQVKLRQISCHCLNENRLR